MRIRKLILVGLAFITLLGSRPRQSFSRRTVRTTQRVVDAFYKEHLLDGGRVPTSNADAVALARSLVPLREWPSDEWGRSLHARIVGDRILVFSAGADGSVGTTDDLYYDSEAPGGCRCL